MKKIPIFVPDIHFQSYRFLLKVTSFWHWSYLFLKLGVGSPDLDIPWLALKNVLDADLPDIC